MEIEPPPKSQTVSFVVVLAFLLIIAGTMIAVFVLTMRQAKIATDAKTVSFLIRLAWVSVALLGLTAVMLFWAVLHFIIRRMKPAQHEPTEYVNAWSLAGQRAKPIDEGDDESDDEPDDDGPDKPRQ